jgi:uncharacterized Zn-finger protein
MSTNKTQRLDVNKQNTTFRCQQTKHNIQMSTNKTQHLDVNKQNTTLRCQQTKQNV